MMCFISILLALVFVPLIHAQNGLSSTSVTNCLTKLGTTSVASIPTTANLRSLTINTLQKSTYTPTATSTPPDATTTLSFTDFLTTTTTLPNTEIDTFSTTTTVISQQLLTATVTATTTQTNVQTTTVYGTTTVPTPPYFTPAQVEQAQQHLYKRDRSPFGGGAVLPGELNRRQAAASASASDGASGYVYTEAVSCTGFVEFFSIKTTVVATASPVTSTLPVITDTTSITETTTITSSVLQTPASTTETLTSTVITTSLAGTTTSTVTATVSSTSTVQGPQTTVYAACQPNNFISNGKDKKPIHALMGPSPFGGTPASPEAVLSTPNAYGCCVACMTSYGSTCGGAAFNTGTGQCSIYDGTKQTSGNFAGGCQLGDVAQILGYYSSSYKPATGLYTLSNGPCGSTTDLDPAGSD